MVLTNKVNIIFPMIPKDKNKGVLKLYTESDLPSYQVKFLSTSLWDYRKLANLEYTLEPLENLIFPFLSNN